MNKEIEEMREKQRQERLLQDYLREAIARQLDDRQLHYCITIMDPKTGGIMTGISGNPGQLQVLLTNMTDRITRALADRCAELKAKLKTIEDPTWRD